MNNCIFCKIVEGKAPAVKIWENRDYMAIHEELMMVRDEILENHRRFSERSKNL